MPKRPAVLSVSPITRSETNLDVSVEESGPVRADESGPVRVDEFCPTSADEDVVQEAEELKHVPAQILPSKAEVVAHDVPHVPFRSWCSACVRGRRLSLGHRKVDPKTKAYRLSVWIMGSLDDLKTDHMTHFQCSPCETTTAKASGVTPCRRRVRRTRILQGL